MSSVKTGLSFSGTIFRLNLLALYVSSFLSIPFSIFLASKSGKVISLDKPYTKVNTIQNSPSCYCVAFWINLTNS